MVAEFGFFVAPEWNFIWSWDFTCLYNVTSPTQRISFQNFSKPNFGWNRWKPSDSYIFKCFKNSRKKIASRASQTCRFSNSSQFRAMKKTNSASVSVVSHTCFHFYGCRVCFFIAPRSKFKFETEILHVGRTSSLQQTFFFTAIARERSVRGVDICECFRWEI